MEQFARISNDIGVMGGKACISGTRITVGAILMLIGEGVSTKELLAEYPNLSEEDISEALRYAAWAVGTKEDVILPA